MDLEETTENLTCPSPTQILNGLSCPITRELFNIPATIGGKTYEKSALLRWFKKCNKHIDPLTGKDLSNDQLTINYSIIYLVDIFLQKNPKVPKFKLSPEDEELIKEYDNRCKPDSNSLKPDIVFQFILPNSELAHLSLPVN